MKFFKSKSPLTIEHDPEEVQPVMRRVAALVTREADSRVEPLVRGCPLWLEKNYAKFYPHYRDGLDRFVTRLKGIEWSDRAGCFVALYEGYAGGVVRAVWAWRDGRMVELEQSGPTDQIYPIDRRWLEEVKL